MYDKHRITSIVTWIAGLVAIAVTILLPLGYFTVSYQHITGSLETEAEMTSHIVTELINSNPDLWQFEQLRLEEVLAQRVQKNHTESKRIFDQQNVLVAEIASPLRRPVITRRFVLMDAGIPAGTFEISTSLNSLLLRSGLMALFGLFCGVTIFVTLRILPLRAVDLAEKSLRESKAELTDKVALLEAALAKVKQLEGIIPICMYCKKIRNDQESWQQLEGYISEHSEAHFSHGICPDCFRKAYAEAEEEFK